MLFVEPIRLAGNSVKFPKIRWRRLEGPAQTYDRPGAIVKKGHKSYRSISKPCLNMDPFCVTNKNKYGPFKVHVHF